MRRTLPLVAVFCSTVLLLAGIGSALTADVPTPPAAPTGSETVSKGAPDAGERPYWVEVGGKRSN